MASHLTSTNVPESTPSTGGYVWAARVAESRVGKVGFSLLDQGSAAGAMFVANVVLARTQTKEDYGLFVLSYSVYSFLAGMHNAAILEPYTVYGSGKYHAQFANFLKLMRRANAAVCLLITLILAIALIGISAAKPQWMSKSLIGLVIAASVLLSAAFWRRTFYIEREAHHAASISTIFLGFVCLGLFITARSGVLSSFTAFLLIAAAWLLAAMLTARPMIFGSTTNNFLQLHPGYWHEHWRYARWIVLTALIFQFSTQGYYWIVAGRLSLREVAAVRAMYMIVSPVDQFFVAMSYLVLPRMAYQYAARNRQPFLSLWKRYQLFSILATGAMFVALLFIGPSLVHWAYGGKFDDSVKLLFVLAALPLVMGIGNPLNLALKAMAKPNAVFCAYLAGSLVTCIFGLPLVKAYGALGAGIGMLSSAAVYAIVLAVSFTANSLKPQAPARITL